MWECGRQQCLPCQGRALLAQELEEIEMAEQDPGGPQKPRPGREDTKSLPKCTTESVGYHLECWGCRKEGRKAVYVGHTSRSPYQRGKEHQEEVDLTKKVHPLVIHFQEVHNGERQTILMRVLKSARTALER